MTLKRAIRIASAWSQGHVCTLRDGDAEEYHRMALEAFRAMQEAEKNEPLTENELDGLDEQPIYFVPKDGRYARTGWRIYQGGKVAVKSREDKSTLYFYYRKDYGEKWAAYRHPTEKEET